jgi:Family of unknown function (DUF6167)
VRRLFWLSLGVAVGALAVRRVTRLTHAWTPEGIAGQADAFGESMRDFADDVLIAARDREAELRESLGIPTEPADRAD